MFSIDLVDQNLLKFTYHSIFFSFWWRITLDILYIQLCGLQMNTVFLHPFLSPCLLFLLLSFLNSVGPSAQF